jgi:hypothetical protein
MKWVTREHVHVDRVACPWLIKRFIDREAEFAFVPKDTDPTIIKDGIVFDMKGVRLGHKGDRCSFDALVETYGITDPAVKLMQEFIRDADSNGGKGSAMGAALRVVAEGYALLLKDDYQILEKEFIFYDALYAYYRNEVGK